MQVVRFTLNGTCLPKLLWGKVRLTAVYLINRLPHVVIGKDAPYFKLLGKQVNL